MARSTQILLLKKDDREYVVKFKWTVSRARDTYGYNICTAYVEGYKVGSCKGGGYDMKGVALADWLKQFVKPEHNFYGLYRYDDGFVRLDGACGLETLLNGLGFTYRWVE